MKILLVSLARRGAMAHHLIEHAKSISPFSEVYAITSNDIAMGSLDSNVKHYQINTGRKKMGTVAHLFNPAMYFNLVSSIKIINPDIIHMTSQHEWNPIVAWIIRKLLKFPLVYTVFDPTMHEGTPLYFTIPEMLVRKIPDAFIVQTNWLKNDFVSKGHLAEKTYVIQLGAYSAITKWKNEEIEKTNIILFFGRIDLHKGVDTLLFAAPLFLDKLPNWELVIAGRGDFQPYQHLVHSDRIKVINRFIENQHAAQLFQQAKIVVLPYRSATSSGVVANAYEFGNPVVATNVGSLGDIVENRKTGLLIPPEDPEILANALISLAKNEKYREELGKNALQYTKEKLSWSFFAKEHLKVYQQVIDKFQSEI